MALVFWCFSGLTVLILSVIGGDQSGSSMAAVGVYVLRPDVPCLQKKWRMWRATLPELLVQYWNLGELKVRSTLSSQETCWLVDSSFDGILETLFLQCRCFRLPYRMQVKGGRVGLEHLRGNWGNLFPGFRDDDAILQIQLKSVARLRSQLRCAPHLRVLSVLDAVTG